MDLHEAVLKYVATTDAVGFEKLAAEDATAKLESARNEMNEAACLVRKLTGPMSTDLILFALPDGRVVQTSRAGETSIVDVRIESIGDPVSA